MAELLYINNILIELPNNIIGQTKQVNDIGDLSDRQSNYSNNIKIPNTPSNIKAFELLGLAGSTTRIPYDEVDVKYVYDGIELISDGVGIIKNTNNFFNLVIYDGNRDIVKLLGKKQLNSIDFSAYNHNLNISNWIDSFGNTSGYIYGLGKFYNNARVSVFSLEFQNVSFYLHTLISEIFTQKGYTISGSLLSDPDYLSRVISMDIGHSRDIINDKTQVYNNNISDSVNLSNASPFFDTNVIDSYVVTDTTVHELKFNGTFTDVFGGYSLRFRVNGVLNAFTINLNGVSVIDETVDVQVSVGDFIEIEVGSASENDGGTEKIEYSINLTTTINSNDKFISINIEDLIGDVTQIDLIKDIMQRFGAVYRKVRNKNEFEFVKMSSILSDFNNAEDWSNKFSEKTNESYKSNYGQQNFARYIYDEDSENFADGSFDISDVNLQTTKTILTSLFKSSNLDSGYNILNHWEVKTEDSEDVVVPKTDGLRIFNVSKVLDTIKYKFEEDVVLDTSFTGTVPVLDFQSVFYQAELDKNYKELNSLLDDYKIVTVNSNLNLIDIYELDLFKLKYFDQLGKFYYLNKVKNFKKNRKTVIELIEVGDILEFDKSMSVNPTMSISATANLIKLLTGEMDANGSLVINMTANLISATFTSFDISTPQISSVVACGELLTLPKYHDGEFITAGIGDIVYNDSGGVTPYNGGSNWHKTIINTSIRINSIGVVTDSTVCV